MVRAFSRLNVRLRVMMIAVLALVPPLALVVYTAAQWHRHEVMDAAEDALEVVRHYASTLEHEVNGAERLLITLGHVMSAAQDRDEILELLKSTLKEHPRYRTLGTIAHEGVIVSAGDPVDPRALAARPVFAKAAETRSFAAAGWEFDAATRQTVATFVLPPGRAGSHGVVFGVMDLGWVPMLAARENLLPAGSAVTVFDERARILGRWPEEDWVGRLAKDDSAITAALDSGHEGFIEATSPLDRVPRIIAFTPMHDFNGARLLYLSVGVPRAVATHQADRILLQDLGVFGAAILFCLSTLALASNRFVVPFLEEPARIAREHNVELVAANAALQAEVAERRRAEEAVEILSLAIEQTADSVLITNREGLIEYVNPAFEDMTGYTRAEAIARTPRLLKSGLHPSAFYQVLWRTVLSGQTFRSTMRNRRKNGALYDEDQTISPVRDGTGTITHFVSTGRDITRRRTMEAALRRLNTALEQEATRIAGILHDEAGQFLTASHITLADVARVTPPEVSERLLEVRRHLDHVEEQLRHMSHELHPRVVQDLGLVNAVNFFVEGFARRTGITVTVESSVENRYPLHVEAIIYRAVQEGLTNVHRHARATTAVVTLHEGGQAIICTVHDNGVGFDPTVALSRGDEASLGLRIMRDRVEAAGGTLTIRSVHGQGTELRVSVPIEV
jgi:PAS domain S-box-containing protein